LSQGSPLFTIEGTTEEGKVRTADLGGKTSNQDMTLAIIDKIKTK